MTVKGPWVEFTAMGGFGEGKKLFWNPKVPLVSPLWALLSEKGIVAICTFLLQKQNQQQSLISYLPFLIL